MGRRRGDHVPDVQEGCGRFFRPGYNANLINEWLRALDGVVDKLTGGITVADLGGTLLCTPSSLSQDVALPLGARAGPERIRDVVTSAGFTRSRKAAETPSNRVYEIRP